MTFFDIIFVADVLLLVVAGILFLMGRMAGSPLAARLALPAKILLIMALATYLLTEIAIGKGGNLIRGLLLFAIGTAIYYLFFRKKQKG